MKYFLIPVILLSLASCKQKKDACSCKKASLADAKSKEALDCDDYFRTLDLEEQKQWSKERLECK
jgi:hypothetical protein